MLFQDVIPDTSGYMILGYSIFFIVTAVYLVSFFVRSRNFNQDLFMLENMKQESLKERNAASSSKSKPAKPKTSKPKPAAAKVKKKK